MSYSSPSSKSVFWRACSYSLASSLPLGFSVHAAGYESSGSGSRSFTMRSMYDLADTERHELEYRVRLADSMYVLAWFSSPNLTSKRVPILLWMSSRSSVALAVGSL